MTIGFCRDLQFWNEANEQHKKKRYEAQMNIKVLKGGSAIAVLLFSLAILPAPASAIPLSTVILGNETIPSGDLTFGSFQYTNTGDMPSDAAVDVSAFTDASGNVGLIFTGAFLDFIGGSGSDAFITFVVNETDPTKLISGATLTGNPTVTGPPGAAGIASVTETFVPTDPLMLNIFAQVSPPTSSQLLTDSGSFQTPQSQVFVQKDALAFSANSTGVPMLSFISQTFHEVNNNIPEPATLLLLSTGMLTLALAGYRRRQ
jgi:PEP-CTERM motif